MEIGEMRDRIILLAPGYSYIDEMNKTVPAWVPFCPFKPEMSDNPPVLIVTEGSNEPKVTLGKSLADAKKYEVWASAAPTTGREYEEAQKLRAETTWKITMRYSDKVKSNFKVFVRGQVLNIESVLDIKGCRKQLQLICTEVDGYGREGI